MARQKRKTLRQETTEPTRPEEKTVGWIPPQTGLKIVTLLSLGIALFTGGQVYWKTHLGAAALRIGVISGISIWIVFVGVLFITRILRRHI